MYMYLLYSFGGSDGHKALHRASAGGQIFDEGHLHRKELEWTSLEEREGRREGGREGGRERGGGEGGREGGREGGKEGGRKREGGREGEREGGEGGKEKDEDRSKCDIIHTHAFINSPV